MERSPPLNLTPDRLPAGLYLPRLEIAAPGGDALIGRAQTAFAIRRP